MFFGSLNGRSYNKERPSETGKVQRQISFTNNTFESAFGILLFDFEVSGCGSLADQHNEEMHFDRTTDDGGQRRYHSNLSLQTRETARIDLVQETSVPGLKPRSVCSLLLCENAETRRVYFGLQKQFEERTDLLRNDRQSAVELQR